MEIDSQKLVDEAAEKLVEVTKELRETRRILARDWDIMVPRERSGFSRQADELEQKRKELEQTIELNSFA